MNNEIKEILEALKPQDKEFVEAGIKEFPLQLTPKEQKILLDYITNLQEKYERMKENAEILSNGYDELVKQKEKAIEYINKNIPMMITTNRHQKLLNILQGDDKE